MTKKNDGQEVTLYAPVLESNLVKSEDNLFNIEQVNFMFKKTPAEHIYKRPAKGGGEWEYVTGVYVKKCLNSIFGWDWDFEVIDFKIMLEAKQVIVHGKLTGRVKGRPIVKHQFGRADIKFKTETVKVDGKWTKQPTNEPLDLGNDLKAATTDCTKKCASEIGIASDVYGKKEFKSIQVIPDDIGEVPEQAWKQLKTVQDLTEFDLLKSAWSEQLGENKAWVSELAKVKRKIKLS